MKLLLDTNTLLWTFLHSSRLPAQVREILADLENDIFVSAAAAWEIATKVSVGKLRLPADTTDYLQSRFEAFDFKHLPITYEHALATRHLPMHHRDPFDRILIAQALLEGLTIVTGEKLFQQYGVATILV